MLVSDELRKNTIVDLLNHLIKDRRDLSWKIEPALANGTDSAVFQILIFEIKSNITLGRLVFDEQDGKLLSMQVRGLAKPTAQNIVDAILDVITIKEAL
jgi:hypothetical protein